MLNKDIVNRLVDLPKKIQEKELLYLENQDELDELNLKLKLIENQTNIDVAAVEIKDGKKEFSNKEKREVEVKKRLDNNDTYHTTRKMVSDMIKKKKTDEIMIWYLKRKFSAAKALARLEIE